MGGTTLSVVLYSGTGVRSTPETLEAILGERVVPLELIVVDDAPNDAMAECLDRFQGHRSRVRVIRTRESVGRLGALNRGLSIATGDLVYAAGAGERILRGCFEKVVDMFARYPKAGFCCVDVGRIEPTTGGLSRTAARWSDTPRYLHPDELADGLRGHEVATRAAFYNRRILLQECGFFCDLGWLAEWFTRLVIGLRHGACCVPELLVATAATPPPQPSPVERDAVLAQLLRLLRSESYRDLLGLAVAARILSTFRPDVERVVLADAEHWEVESLLLIEHPLDLAAVKNRVRAMLEAGKVAVAEGRLGAAQEIFSSAVREFPRLHLARLLLAKVAVARGEVAVAARALKEAARIAPDDPEVHLQFGLMHRATGDDRRAEADFRRTLESAPNNIRGVLALAETLQALGRDAEAAWYYNGALQLHPGNLELLMAVGRLAAKLGQPATARIAWHLALSLDPGAEQARRALHALETSAPKARRRAPATAEPVSRTGRPVAARENPPAARGDGPTRFHFVMVVWGQAYTEMFLEVSLPTQLAPGNLGAFPHAAGSAYKIYTTRADADRIRRSPAYADLVEIMPCEIVAVDDLDVGDKYLSMANCHQHAIQAANDAGAVVVVLAPDTAWSDGAFSRVAVHAAAGRRAVMIAGIRVVRETFVPACRERHGRSGPSISIQPRELVRLALGHLHPISRSLFWDATEFSTWPSHLYWPVADEGFIARCFHLHPLMLRPGRQALLAGTTVDAGYVALACPDPGEVYVVEDSDEMVVIEMSSERDSVGRTQPHGASVFDVARWATGATTPLHRDFARHPVRFHAGDLGPEWRAAEERSEAVIASTLFFFTGVPVEPTESGCREELAC